MALTENELFPIYTNNVYEAGKLPMSDALMIGLRAIESAATAPLLARIAALTAQVEQAAQPVQAQPSVRMWHDRIKDEHPTSDPQYWPNALKVEYMEREILDLRALVAQPKPASQPTEGGMNMALTDQEIGYHWRIANLEDDSWMPQIHERFARAIESAATAPLLARIAALTAQVEQAAQPVGWWSKQYGFVFMHLQPHQFEVGSILYLKDGTPAWMVESTCSKTALINMGNLAHGSVFYTAPPKAVPLTDEQINDAMAPRKSSGTTYRIPMLCESSAQSSKPTASHRPRSRK